MTPLFCVIIPFRDRGEDPLRAMNLSHVLDMWENYGYTPLVCTDGRGGKQQFNRSAAYNRGVSYQAAEPWDGYIFAESDMLVDERQIDEAEELALAAPGMVVPFTQYRYLKPEDSCAVRNGVPADGFTPDWVMDNGRSIGAINVVSRKTLDMVGRYDERFEGNWYDDDAMKIAFDVCAGPTRYVEGRAYHLWHRPGHHGDHLTPEDKAATAANKRRLGHYQFAARTKNVARIRQLTGGSS